MLGKEKLLFLSPQMLESSVSDVMIPDRRTLKNRDIRYDGKETERGYPRDQAFQMVVNVYF